MHFKQQSRILLVVNNYYLFTETEGNCRDCRGGHKTSRLTEVSVNKCLII